MLTSRHDGHCLRHARQLRRVRNTVYDDPRWKALRASEIKAHVGRFGWTCPGALELGHEPHASTDLSLDHVKPLSRGGAPFDRRNTRVLCGPWNSRKGASVPRGNIAAMAPA